MVLSCLPGASLVPRRLSNWSFSASLVPPWCCLGCLPGCPNGPFLLPWCLPGASQAVQSILSCLPGASQAVQLVLSSLVPRRLSNWSFSASLAPPWCCLGCLPGCPNGPFLPPWCLPGAFQAVQLILSRFPGASQTVQSILAPWCLPGASQAVQLVLAFCPISPFLPPWCLPGASLVPSRLSCFPGASQAV